MDQSANAPRVKKKRSPPLPYQNKKLQSSSSLEHQSSFEEGSQVSAKPNKGGSSYVELRFSHGGGDYETATPSVACINPVKEPPAILHDPKTKYDYSTILFDETKRKNIIAAERLKKDRGPPPPIRGKYQGDISKHMKKLKHHISDSNPASLQQPREQKFQGKARPISAGASRTPATAQNGVNQSYGDYEGVDFEGEEEEFENVPRKQKSLDNDRPLRDTRVLGPSPARQLSGDYENVDEEIDDRSAAASVGGGYKNVELDRDERLCRATDRSDHDKLNPPLPAKQSQAAHWQRPNQLPPMKQPQSTGTVNHDYVNLQYPAVPPPQPKPRYGNLGWWALNRTPSLLLVVQSV